MSDDGRESVELDDETYNYAVSWAKLIYEDRASISITTPEHVAMFWNTIRATDEQMADQYIGLLVADSEKYQFAWDALWLLVAGHRQEKRELPPKLETWSNAVWIKMRGGDSGRPSSGAHAYFITELDIYDIVTLMVERFRVTATKNPATGIQRSACHIVADAVDKPYNTVAAIYGRCLRSPVRRYQDFLRKRLGHGNFTLDLRKLLEIPIRRRPRP